MPYIQIGNRDFLEIPHADLAQGFLFDDGPMPDTPFPSRPWDANGVLQYFLIQAAKQKQEMIPVYDGTMGGGKYLAPEITREALEMLIQSCISEISRKGYRFDRIHEMPTPDNFDFNGNKSDILFQVGLEILEVQERKRR